MSEKKNIAIVRRLFDEVFTGGNISLLDTIIDSNVKLHDPSSSQFQGGLKGFKQREEVYAYAFPSKTLVIDELFSSGDTVAVRWNATGTHERELPGIPATGKDITITGTSIFLLKGGKVVEIYQNWDELGMLSQLGAYSTSAYAGQR